MNDRDDLIRAVVTHPDEDTPRLMYADWLEENATSDADRARAEYIRVSCEQAILLAEWGVPMSKKASEMTERQREIHQRLTVTDEREAVLRLTHSAAWRRPPCAACEGAGWVYVDSHEHEGQQQLTCPACGGSGSTGALSERDPKPPRDGTEWEHHVEWVRGFPVVRVPFAEMGAGDPWDFTPDWLAWACRAVREEGASFRVEGVDDCLGGGYSGLSYCWWRYDAIYDHSPRLPTMICPKNQYDSPAEAHAALASAVTALVVERAY